jgi:hypothetical protein
MTTGDKASVWQHIMAWALLAFWFLMFWGVLIVIEVWA